MRLREIQKILEDNIEELEIPQAYNRSTSSTLLRTDNYPDFINAVNNVAPTGLFEEQISYLSDKHLIIVLGNKQINFEQASINSLKIASKEMVNIANGALSVIRNSFKDVDEPQETLAILLPDIKVSFKLMSLISKELDTFFRLLKIIPDFNTDIKIEAFDKGSNWFLILLGSDTALRLLSKLVNIVYKSRLQNTHLKALSFQLDSLHVSNDSLKEVKEALISQQMEMYRQLADEFLEATELDTKGEIQSQMTQVIKTLDNIYDMGVSFQPSVNANLEAIEKFPDLDSQKSMFNLDTLKKITFDSEN